MVARARAWLAGEIETVEPRSAATVMLLRDRPTGLEVYLIRRVTSMAFAGGMYAYPGGGVDPRDGTAGTAWTGPAPTWWAGRLGCPVPAAQALVVAAVRETCEEAGVVLAGPDADSVVADTTGADWLRDRERLVARETSYTGLLAERGLTLRADLLAPWARWITPEFEPRRYDTYFFLAALPAGQRTAEQCGEADLASWVRPADAVRDHAAGALAMLPPTVATLAALAGYATVAEALAAAADRDLAPVLPIPKVEGDLLGFEYPA